MSSPNQTEDDYAYSAKGGWIDFLATFGGVLLIISAGFEVLQGAAAIANPEFFASGDEYLYRFSGTTWGWTHLILGVLSAVVAIGIFMRKPWAWLAGIVIVGLTMLTNFASLPQYPVWSVTIIAIDVAIIWALSMQLGRRP